ncbi:MAG: hypothetical protein M3125_01705 [Gemmatimonadota bacterium]|nr:hypothetical protein [Gemmatimonadota bacterium]
MLGDGARRCRSLLTWLVTPGVIACGGDPARSSGVEPPLTLRERALAAGLAAMPFEPPRPLDNPFLPERVELGHLLFFDAILSGPQDVACSTCHLPDLAMTDGRQFPSGAGATGLAADRTLPGPPPLREMPRNSPTTHNIGMFGRMGNTTPTTDGTMFWGANAFGLEDQVLLPISADNELRGLTYSKVIARDSVLARLRRNPEYVERFAAAFPELSGAGVPVPEAVITTMTLRRALAAYIRELNTPHAPLDEFLRGSDASLTPQQKAGLDLFIGKAYCVVCHTGPLLSDFAPHVLGTAQAGLGRDTTPGDDLGWGEHGGVPYSFRTAPLRQVALTAPYFHAGTALTLEAVLEFKNRGESAYERVPASALDPHVRPLHLTTTELADVIAFLHALTDTVTTRNALFLAPERVPSGLPIPK